MYETNGGRLTRESSFGEDPLRNDAFLVQERERLFRQRNPDLDSIHGNLLTAIRCPLKLPSFLYRYNENTGGACVVKHLHAVLSCTTLYLYFHPSFFFQFTPYDL